MIDPTEPAEIQIQRQARIIEALIRRAGRQHEVSTSAYAAFQSAVALQGQVWAKTRDLERASSELETLRFDRARTQKNLADALSVLDGGFALFEDDRLHVCNELFARLLPDISDRIVPGLPLETYLDLAAGSDHLLGREGRDGVRSDDGGDLATFVVELSGDRWFQFSRQRTSKASLVILLTEITGIVRANRLEKDALIDMQAHYLQAAFDNMAIGIATFSRAGGLAIRNDRFRDLLGLPARLMQTGTPFADILTFLREKSLIAEMELDGIDGWPLKLRRRSGLRARLRHAGGWVLDLHVHLLPDRGFLVDITDVTLEHRATEVLEKEVDARTRDLTDANRRLTEQSRIQSRVEDELRVAKEAAEAAVSSKTRFLAAASHDLLQPINAAKLLISTLEDMSRGGELAGMVTRLQDTFTSVETLLHALLDISRLESTDAALTPQDVCLGPLMEAVTEDQAPLARKRGLRLDVVPSSIWVRSDQRYLLRSIQNLVVNALQYTESGRVLVGCRRRGDRVVLQVWDTGIGISLADQARIFQEFTRAGNPAPDTGIGLGLSIVERTCRHLDHALQVRSSPGQGSVFSIEMATAEAGEVPVRRSPVSEEGELDVLALVVENDADVLFATVSKLESWGASVFAATSTAEALDLLGDAATAPDVVLADYQLDGEDNGLETIRAVRDFAGWEVPAIIVTADRSPALIVEGARENVTVLPKPVDLARLRRTIAHSSSSSGTEAAPDESRL